MKRVIALSTALLLVTALTVSCNSDSGSVQGTVDPVIVGRWVLFEVTAYGGPWSPDSIDWAFQISLGGDGVYSITETWEGSTESWSGRWGTDGGILYLSEDGSGAYFLAGDVLTYDTADYDGEGTPGILKFRKQ